MVHSSRAISRSRLRSLCECFILVINWLRERWVPRKVAFLPSIGICRRREVNANSLIETFTTGNLLSCCFLGQMVIDHTNFFRHSRASFLKTATSGQLDTFVSIQNSRYMYPRVL
ncbi:uncharacterized protein BDW70DRAFT_68983 [Aspergillus foveolatus]|uniref:uncharacterized protein n=1 Tax=Aspergillus foveolatus TaxID=210207 RepID=UPI003CCDD051